MPTLSALNSTKSSALIDTNNDGNLAEITNPALKAALATNENSGWNFNTDSVSAAAFNSLMVKATKAADTSPTIKNAADKVAVAQKKLDEAGQAQEKSDNTFMKKVGLASVVAMLGGLVLALVGLPAVGLAIVSAGAIGTAAVGISGLFTMKKEGETSDNLNTATAQHESALAEMLKAYNEVRANRVVARATNPRAALESWALIPG